jgi:cytochrome c peroxidase
VAVRAGVHHILFSDQPEGVPAAMDAWLKSLRPLPSPHLVNGQLSAAATRGKELFMSTRTGCALCHRPPLFTDLSSHDVGTAGQFGGYWGKRASDSPSDRFQTPALVELWRTGPFLHNGSAASLRDVLIKKNTKDQHGQTSQLTAQEVEDLIEYLLSL